LVWTTPGDDGKTTRGAKESRGHWENTNGMAGECQRTVGKVTNDKEED